MIEIRIHGRGGQGVVTAAELLASAAFRDGEIAQVTCFIIWLYPTRSRGWTTMCDIMKYGSI